MTRKGTSYLFKIGFPTPSPERRTLEAKKTFKDNWEYRDPSAELEGFPLPAPPAPAVNAVENEVSSNEYYQNCLTAIDGSIASSEEKLDQAIGNPEINPSSVKKMARKLGRDQKFLKSVKAEITCLATTESGLEPELDEQEQVQVGPPVEQALGQGWCLLWSSRATTSLQP